MLLRSMEGNRQLPDRALGINSRDGINRSSQCIQWHFVFSLYSSAELYSCYIHQRHGLIRAPRNRILRQRGKQSCN